MPPNQRTTIIIIDPRNSLTGCASACRIATLDVVRLSSLLVCRNLSFILSSAMNALMILSPPSVSSSWDMVSLHFACASRDSLLSCLPIALMAHAIRGTTRSVNRVSCQLVKSSVAK